MKFKSVLIFDPREKKYRLCRVTWERGAVGHCVSFALMPTFARIARWPCEWRVVLLGFSVHWRCGGGRFA